MNRRRALVTGGASGLGEATAERLRKDDIEVVTLDLSPSADVVADIADPTALQEAIAAVGSIDILINSAGIVGPNVPLWEVSPEEWARTFAVTSWAPSSPVVRSSQA
jgi:3-oxoacyl-[acyl-carrier protein] reductase